MRGRRYERESTTRYVQRRMYEDLAQPCLKVVGMGRQQHWVVLVNSAKPLCRQCVDGMAGWHHPPIRRDSAGACDDRQENASYDAHDELKSAGPRGGSLGVRAGGLCVESQVSGCPTKM